MGSVLAARQVRKERSQPTVSKPDLGDGSEGQSSIRRHPPRATPGARAVVLTAERSPVFQGGVLKTAGGRGGVCCSWCSEQKALKQTSRMNSSQFPSVSRCLSESKALSR